MIDRRSKWTIGRRRWVTLSVGAALALVGCRTKLPTVHLPPPYTAFRSPHLTEAPPRRVLVMPPVAPPQHMATANLWVGQLANELRSIRSFEVVVASPNLAPVANCLADIQRGQYSEHALIELRNALRVDAVLFVSFHDCYAYWPPRMAAGVNLVETVHGETLASVDGNWDARDETTRMQALEYAKRVSTARELSDPEVILQSPTYFGKYVAADVAHAICMLWKPESLPVSEEGQGTQPEVAASVQTPDCQPVAPVSASEEELPTPASQ